MCKLALLLTLSLGWLHCHSPTSEPSATLSRACDFLWSKQAQDGGWHSETHGLLKGGQAITPFILHTLFEAPEDACPRSSRNVQRALNFIRTHINEAGALGLSDPDILEYPNYATSYALRVLVRYGEAGDQPLIDKMTAYLLDQQFIEHRGFDPEHLAYGSWGFGERNLPLGHTGHVDLSHTRRVLQALYEANHTESQAFSAAQKFLALLQKQASSPIGPDLYDGGFFASSIVPSVNKSDPVFTPTEGPPIYESYATTTCDGVLALLAAGIPSQDARIQDALHWLRSHPRLEEPEGVAPNHPAQWHKVLFFYHLAVRSEVYQTLDEPGPWQQDMLDLITAKQQKDGSFSNPYGAPNKEDDPLLATAMAVQALHNALH